MQKILEFIGLAEKLIWMPNYLYADNIPFKECTTLQIKTKNTILRYNDNLKTGGSCNRPLYKGATYVLCRNLTWGMLILYDISANSILWPAL